MPKSVLVADDSITMRKAIGMVFAHEDFTVTMVDNGIDAINKARELRPDLVIADCMMPGKTGYDVAHAVRSDPSLASTAVLLLAGTFEPFDENRARASGASAHIVKPFDSQSFMERVRNLVGMAPGAAPISTVSPVSTGAAPVARPAAAPRLPPLGAVRGAPAPPHLHNGTTGHAQPTRSAGIAALASGGAGGRGAAVRRLPGPGRT
jgi:CheY-like chemotaxis protein